jgi:putative NADH-flavin reductase
MKLLIVGATGGTGLCLVDQALAAGHQVTAFVREPAKLRTTHANLSVVKGDVLDAASMAGAVKDQEAVLCALGTRDRSKTNVTVSQGTKNLLAAMKAHGVKRLIVETALGVGDSKAHAGFLVNSILVPLFLKASNLEKERQEAMVKESGLEWTIVRPGGLTDKPLSGKVRGADDRSVSRMVSRADVASFMLQQVGSATWVGKGVAVGA